MQYSEFKATVIKEGKKKKLKQRFEVMATYVLIKIGNVKTRFNLPPPFQLLYLTAYCLPLHTFDGSGRRENKLNTLTNTERQNQKRHVCICTIALIKLFELLTVQSKLIPTINKRP